MTQQNAAPIYNPVRTSDNQDDDSPSLYEVQTRAADDSPNLRRRIIRIIVKSYLETIFFSLSQIMPISLLIIGIIYKDDCTIKNEIPIWLIVSGSIGIALGIIKFFFTVIPVLHPFKDFLIEKSGILAVIMFVFSLIGVAWFIIGNVWVYSIYDTVKYDRVSYPDPDTYCNKVCYLFSFWSITISWVLVIIGCFFTCVSIILAILCPDCHVEKS